MNKHVLIPAALALAAAGAQAQSVTMYGLIDAALQTTDGVAGGRLNSLISGGIQGSRYGFKGSEDLGGGLGAGFWLEAGLLPSSGATQSSTSFFNRRATLSLTGNFGELRLGRDDSATFLNTLVFDPFLTNGVGGTMAFAMNGAPIQISNAVSYFLPKDLGGFFGQAQVALGGQPSTATYTRAGDYSGLRAGYNQGPLNTAFATGVLRGASPALDVTASNLAAAYDFQSVRPSLLWAREKTSLATVDAFQVGLTAPVGPTLLKASYGHYSNNSTGNNSWNKLSLGFGYNLSLRTQIYGSYGHISNQSGAQKAMNLLGLGAAGTSLGGQSNGYEVGFRHFF